MPSLVLFGHRTCIAGDDISVLLVLSILMRLLELSVLVPLTALIIDNYIKNYDGGETKCKQITDVLVANVGKISVAYLVVCYVKVIFDISIQVPMLKNARRGTPTQPELRAPLRNLCQVRILFVFFLLITELVLGVIILANLRDYCSCEIDPYSSPLGGDALQSEIIWETDDRCHNFDESLILTNILTVIQWADFTILGIYLLYFGNKGLPCCRRRLISAETRWRLCCQCCCTFSNISSFLFFGCNETGNGNYSDIALILSDFFDDGGALDVAFSDRMIGFVMLLKVQEQRRKDSRKEIITKFYIKTSNERTSGDQARNYHCAENDKHTSDEDCGEPQSDSNDPQELTKDNQRLARLALRESQMMGDDVVDTVDKSILTRHERDDLTTSLAYQLCHTADLNFYYKPVPRVGLSRRKSADMFAIAEGARFMRLSLGIYGWLMDAKKRPCRSMCVLRKNCVKRARDGFPNSDTIFGDFLGWHEGTLLSITGIHDVELAYACFEVGFSRNPYCIVIDHAWKSVVVAIRGTQTLDDLVADMTMHPESLEEWGKWCSFDGKDLFVHAGMLARTEWIFNDLERHGLLEKLLSPDNPRLSGYTLRLTGHSLGAGIAAILSLLLRSRYPTLRAVCFSPPGCTVSSDIAESSKDYLTSYVLDDDIIPRTSIESLENLRGEILELIARIKVPKAEAWPFKWGKHEDVADLTERVLHRKESTPPSTFREQIDVLHEHQRKLKMERSIIDVPLLPPGKIVHLVKTKEDTGGCLSCGDIGAVEENPYTARWAEANDFREIACSSHLLADHDPSFVLQELERIASSFGICPPFSYTEERNTLHNE